MSVQLSKNTVSEIANILSQMPYQQTGHILNRIMFEVGSNIPGLGQVMIVPERKEQGEPTGPTEPTE